MKVLKRYRIFLIDEKGNLNPNKDDFFSSLFRLYDTEEEAIEACFKYNKWVSYVILPEISFDNFY